MIGAQIVFIKEVYSDVHSKAFFPNELAVILETFGLGLVMSGIVHIPRTKSLNILFDLLYLVLFTGLAAVIHSVTRPLAVIIIGTTFGSIAAWISRPHLRRLWAGISAP